MEKINTNYIMGTLNFLMRRLALLKWNRISRTMKKTLETCKSMWWRFPASVSGCSCSTIKKNCFKSFVFPTRRYYGVIKPTGKNTLHKWSGFGLSVVKPKPKLSERANQKKGEIPFRANKIQSKNQQTA